MQHTDRSLSFANANAPIDDYRLKPKHAPPRSKYASFRHETLIISYRGTPLNFAGSNFAFILLLLFFLPSSKGLAKDARITWHLPTTCCQRVSQVKKLKGLSHDLSEQMAYSKKKS